jgi:hypothetical protein
MTQHVKLVVDDQSLWGISLLEGRDAERLPHVHHREPDFAVFRGSKPDIELIHARFGSVLAAEPNGPAANEVADDDAVAVASADGDLVDTNGLGNWLTGPTELFAHVLFVQLLDRVPIQEQFFGHCLDGTVPTASAHEEGEPFGEKWIVGQPVQAFSLHGDTPRALDATNGEVEIDPLVATGKVPNLAWPLIVEGSRDLTTKAAGRFFSRRWRETTTAWESPKIPCTVAKGSNPGKR